MFTVDIDTGGTMTDALVSDGKEIRAFKVDTTPHDYTVSFRECSRRSRKTIRIRKCSGLPRRGDTHPMVDDDHVQRARRTARGQGRSAGHEAVTSTTSTVPASRRSSTNSWPSRMSSACPRTHRPQDVLDAVKRLFEEGVRRICVSLRGSLSGQSGRDRGQGHYRAAISRITTWAPCRCSWAATWRRSSTTRHAPIIH